jgi:hypothetical protein
MVVLESCLWRTEGRRSAVSRENEVVGSWLSGVSYLTALSRGPRGLTAGFVEPRFRLPNLALS